LAPQQEVPQECVGESFKLEHGDGASVRRTYASVCRPSDNGPTRRPSRDQNSRKAAQPQIKRS
jgi:hypothetical protein